MVAIEQATPTASSTAADPPMIYTLVTSDKEIFVVDKAVAMLCQTLKDLIEDVNVGAAIPISEVIGPVMAKVLEYCKRQVAIEVTVSAEGGDVDEETKEWNESFLDVDQDMLFDLLMAATYLNIKSLQGLLCQSIADMMTGKSIEQIRETFHIVNDYTPEEEDEVRMENAWAFEESLSD